MTENRKGDGVRSLSASACVVQKCSPEAIFKFQPTTFSFSIQTFDPHFVPHFLPSCSMAPQSCSRSRVTEGQTQLQRLQRLEEVCIFFGSWCSCGEERGMMCNGNHFARRAASNFRRLDAQKQVRSVRRKQNCRKSSSFDSRWRKCMQLRTD